jgi:hypothetical protein
MLMRASKSTALCDLLPCINTNTSLKILCAYTARGKNLKAGNRCTLNVIDKIVSFLIIYKISFGHTTLQNFGF